MLVSVSDARLESVEMAATASRMLVSASMRPVQAMLDAGASAADVAALRWHLPAVWLGYLRHLAAASPPTR